jgi:predicted molibdopterin-dependent oxidoreductase YjgC
LAKTLGIAASTNSIHEIRKADCLLIIGADPAQTHPIIRNEVHLAIRQNRPQLIVLGCQDIGLTRAAQLSPLFHPAILLQGNPGFEVPVLNAMAQTVLKQGLEDGQFIEESTEGIADLRKKLLAGERDEAQGFSEELKQEIGRAAKAFAQSKRAMILIGAGFCPPEESREIATASSNLALLTGHMGKASCGILMLLEKCNSQGAIDLGIFPKKGARGSKDFLQKVKEEKLKALYLVGHDPLMSDTDHIAEGMKKLRLLVVQDLFMTETAKMAHVVLPACAFVEKTGTYTSLERRVQKIHPLRSPLGESKSDFDIFVQLLRFLESSIPGETQEAVFEEIVRLNPYYKGIKDGEQWPKDSPYLYATGFPMGKAQLIPVSGTAGPRKADGHPFQLIRRASLFQSGLLSSKSEALDMVSEEPSLELNPEDAEKHQVEDGETVRLSTPGGRKAKVKVQYSPKLQLGVVTVPSPSSLFNEGNIVSVKIEKASKAKESDLK